MFLYDVRSKYSENTPTNTSTYDMYCVFRTQLARLCKARERCAIQLQLLRNVRDVSLWFFRRLAESGSHVLGWKWFYWRAAVEHRARNEINSSAL